MLGFDVRELAVDDYASIRARLEELRRERETAVKGAPIGTCWQCQEKRTPCTGACCED